MFPSVSCSKRKKYNTFNRLQLTYFVFLFFDPIANLSLYFGVERAENIL